MSSISLSVSVKWSDGNFGSLAISISTVVGSGGRRCYGCVICSFSGNCMKYCILHDEKFEKFVKLVQTIFQNITSFKLVFLQCIKICAVIGMPEFCQQYLLVVEVCKDKFPDFLEVFDIIEK